MASRGMTPALALLLGVLSGCLLLLGCGESPEQVRGAAGTGYPSGYTTGSGIPNGTTAYANPGTTYATPTTSNPYGSVPATGTTTGTAPVYGTPPASCGATLPGQTAATPASGQTGCSQPGVPASGTVARPAVPARTGLEAKITSREESGIFSKSLKGVTVAVANNDGAERTRFLLVVFTKKGVEVDVQYKTVRMAAGGNATYSFRASKDADDAKVELRDTLL